MASLLSYSQIFDISPRVTEKIAVFPGDTAYEENFLMDMARGDALTLSKITTTLHLGAHADAPNHYHVNGKGIGERDLSYYLGEAQVVDVKVSRGQRVSLKDFDLSSISTPRVLFKTLSFPDPNQWNGDFAALSPEVIEFLSEKSVRLVGIDTPSVDLADDKKLITHQAIHQKDLAILEGIVLNDVPAGIYHLIALPLRLEKAEASPVRAVLLR